MSNGVTNSDHRPRPEHNSYDAELRRHNELLRLACAIQPRDLVLDIGCGAGLTTRQAARAAREGSALGVDVSAAAIERARELAKEQRVNNITFEHADAQAYRFPRERFDMAISRSARTWPLPSTGSAALPAPAEHLTAWAQPMRHARSDGCARRLPRICVKTVPGSTQAPGLSPLVATDFRSGVLGSRGGPNRQWWDGDRADYR